MTEPEKQDIVAYLRAQRDIINRAADAANVIVRLRVALHAAKRDHYVCGGDCWYSCPKTGESCNELPNDVCDCGADAHNAKIDEALSHE